MTLQDAIKALGAVEVFHPDAITCGQYDQEQRARATLYAYKGVNGYGEPRWLIATLAQITRFDPSDDMPIIEAVMPEWWTPEHRFAWRQTKRGFKGAIIDRPDSIDHISSPTFDAANVTRLVPPNWRRISADLNTGEEICACSSCEAEGKGAFANA